MEYKATEFCKVCENYDIVLNHCRKGWSRQFCNGDEFEPSFKTTVLNLLSLLYESGRFNSETLDGIEDFIYQTRES